MPAGNTEVDLEQERLETPDKIKNTHITTYMIISMIFSPLLENLHDSPF